MSELGEKIDRYENGEMSESEEMGFFQFLVDTGHAWKLNGSYGRRAQQLLTAGKIQPSRRGN